VHVRAARQAGPARRLRGPVPDGQLDAGGHGRPRPPVVPGNFACRPADTRDVRPPAGQRTGVRAHHTDPVVQRRGPRPAVAGAPEHHGIRQHAPLGRTWPTDGPQRLRNWWHTPEPATRIASQSKCLFARPSPQPLSRSLLTVLYIGYAVTFMEKNISFCPNYIIYILSWLSGEIWKNCRGVV